MACQPKSEEAAVSWVTATRKSTVTTVDILLRQKETLLILISGDQVAILPYRWLEDDA